MIEIHLPGIPFGLCLQLSVSVNLVQVGGNNRPGLTNGSHHVDSFVDMDRFNMLDSVMQIKVNYSH